MNRCPITYQECGSDLYSHEGLSLFFMGPASPPLLHYSAEELLKESMIRTTQSAIAGIQSKLSAVVDESNGCFELVGKNGKYILKPQHPGFREVPENEDLTMRLASSIDLVVPFHGLVYATDHSLTYFIKRFAVSLSYPTFDEKSKTGLTDNGRN